jgi:hypothetical protein
MSEGRLSAALEEIAYASWPSVGGDDPVKRIQDFAKWALDDASAIEAATAGETQSGSTEGESAVGDSRDAQSPSSPIPNSGEEA